MPSHTKFVNYNITVYRKHEARALASRYVVNNIDILNRYNATLRFVRNLVGSSLTICVLLSLCIIAKTLLRLKAEITSC